MGKLGPSIFFEGYGPVFVGDGNLEECGYTPTYEDPVACGASPTAQSFCDMDRTADFDGEWEYGMRGGMLPDSHHAPGEVCVYDDALGRAAFFVVGVDGDGDGLISPTLSPGFDFVTAPGIDCVSVPFGAPPGGGWWVRVLTGVAGHIYVKGQAGSGPFTRPFPTHAGASFFKDDPGSLIGVIPWGFDCSVTTGVHEASIVCASGSRPVCEQPTVGAVAFVGTVVGETWCDDSAHAIATASAMTADEARAPDGTRYPWTCVARFPSGATGTVVCSAT